MISLRLSEVEYKGLKAHYKTLGARNVSDLARLALQQIMQETRTDNAAARMADLNDRLQTVEDQLSLLMAHEKRGHEITND
jgi:hypothetical protein